jgi:hypothetical protein
MKALSAADHPGKEKELLRGIFRSQRDRGSGTDKITQLRA